MRNPGQIKCDLPAKFMRFAGHIHCETPAKFDANMQKSVFSLFLMEDWVRQGFILLMPDPCDFDFALRKEVIELADARMKTIRFTPGEMEQLSEESQADVSRFILSAPEDYLKERLRSQNPNVSDEDITKTIDLRNRMVEADPLNIGGSEAQLQITRVGANLEMAMLISNAANAFPFTNLKSRWREILSSIQGFHPDSSVWSPLTSSFQKLNFGFLENVDPKFAKSIRDEGRLQSLRNFLRKVWQKIGDEASPPDSMARDFSDELHDEYAKAKADLAKIDTELAKWTVGTTFSSVSGLLISGHLGVVLSGAAVAGVSLLAKRYLDRRAFRLANPLSVFLDLERNKRWKN